jgi:cytochrome c oxidase subunit 3
LDSQTIATGHAEAHAEHEEHPAYLRHHFVTVDQQRETASFGMWLFLLTEIMFFGGLFMAYLLYRNWYYDAFVASSNTLGIGLGTTNTAVLILSSFTMAMGVYSAEIRSRKGLITSLGLTIVLGTMFLGIKSVEYHDKYVEHHIPGASFSVEDFVHPTDKRDVPLAPDMASAFYLSCSTRPGMAPIPTDILPLSTTSDSIGTSSISSGFFCFRCCT